MADLRPDKPMEDVLGTPTSSDTRTLAQNLRKMENSWGKASLALEKYSKIAEKRKVLSEKELQSLNDIVGAVEKTVAGYTNLSKATQDSTKSTEEHTKALKNAGKETEKTGKEQEALSKKMGRWAETGWGKAKNFVGKYGETLAAGALTAKAATLAFNSFSDAFNQHLLSGAKWDQSFSSMLDTTWRVNAVMGESAVLAVQYGKGLEEVQQIAKRIGTGVARGSLLAEGGEKKITRLTEATLQFKRDLMLSDEEVGAFFEQQAFRFGKSEEQYTSSLAMIRAAAEASNEMFGPGQGLWVDQMAQHIKSLTVESQHYSQNTDLFVSAYQRVFDTVKAGTNNFSLATEAAEKFTKALSAPPPWIMTKVGQNLVKDAQSDWSAFSKTLGDVSPDVKKQIKSIVDSIGITTSEYQAGQAMMELVGQESIGLKGVFGTLQGLVKGGGAGGTQLLTSMFGMNYNEAIQTADLVRNNDFSAFADMVKKTKKDTKPVGGQDMFSTGGMMQMASGGLTTLGSIVKSPFEDLRALGGIIPMLMMGGAVRKKWPKWKSGQGLLGRFLGPGAAAAASGAGGATGGIGGGTSLGGVVPVSSSDMNITTATINISSASVQGLGGVGGGTVGKGGGYVPVGGGYIPSGGGGKKGSSIFGPKPVPRLGSGSVNPNVAGKWVNVGGKLHHVQVGGKIPKVGMGTKIKGFGKKVGKGMKGKGGKLAAIGGLGILASMAFGGSDAEAGTPTGDGTMFTDPTDYLDTDYLAKDVQQLAADSPYLDALTFGYGSTATSLIASGIAGASKVMKGKGVKNFDPGKSLMDLQIAQAKKNIQAEVAKNVGAITAVTPEALKSLEQKNKALLQGGTFGTNNIKMPMKIEPNTGNIILQGGYGEIVKMEGKRKLLGAK